MRLRTASLPALAAALLAACTSAPSVAPVDTDAGAARAAEALERGDAATARDLYAALVARSQGTDRDRFRLGLARAEVELGNAELALAELDAITAPSTASLEAERSLVRASALFRLGRTVEAVTLLVEREIWLESPAEIRANHAAIWDGLSLPASATGARRRTGDSMIDGWLALTPLTRLTDDSAELIEAILAWREEFPNHPAAGSVLAENLAARRGDTSRADRIALLLPLSAVETRTRALALLEGFFAHHFDSGMAEQRTVRVYDTAQRGSVDSFLTAQLEGADFIVGPLLSEDVAQVQAQAGFVPTLALNLGTSELTAAPNFYQFALSTDDEVEAIAARAIADGHETAIVLVSSSERGYRLADSFRDAFESRGGRVIGQSAYVSDQDQQTFQTPIEQLLNISTSEARRRRLQSDLGQVVEFEPRRRADIDMIFLQAEPADGRLLVPLLRANGAGEIPTYALSQVFDPTRPGADPDLNGLIFPELPLLIDPAGGGRAASSRLGEFTPVNAEQEKRLFAFGYDAYALVGALALAGNARWPVSGATGELYLGDNGRVRRVLPFAEFRGGRPEALPTTLGSFSSR